MHDGSAIQVDEYSRVARTHAEQQQLMKLWLAYEPDAVADRKML